MRARPLSVSSARLTSGSFGQLAHADRRDLCGRNPQRHLVLDEVDDEQLELGPGDLLLLDREDLADAMGGVDDELAGLEALTLGCLLDGHAGSCSFVRPGGADGCLGHGCGAARRVHAQQAVPAGGRRRLSSWSAGLRRRFSWTYGAFFLPRTFCVVLTSLADGSSGTPGKNTLPMGSGSGAVYLLIFKLYSTFFAEIKALGRGKSGIFGHAGITIFVIPG